MELKIKVSILITNCLCTKKDGSLRLCCDYWELNQKSIPDRHPISRVQDMLNSLSGSVCIGPRQSVPSGVHGGKQPATHSIYHSLGAV